MDKKKIKRIIAREGLIIISLIASIFFIGTLNGNLREKYDGKSKLAIIAQKMNEYKSPYEDEKQKDRDWRIESIKLTGATDAELSAWILLYDFRGSLPEYKDMSLENLLPVYKKRFPDDKHFESTKQNLLSFYKKVDTLERQNNYYNVMRRIADSFSSLLMFLIFGAYPLYLLIRFIIWALRTLGEGK